MPKPARSHAILFLCTGNYYRSRYAEIVFNSVADKMGLPWQASSRGLALERGVNNVGPLAASVVQAIESMGLGRKGPLEAATRFPIQVTRADLEQAQRIVALKQTEHLPLLQERFPEESLWSAKVEFWHVEDALGVLPLIEQQVHGLVARLLGGVEGPTESKPDSMAEVGVGAVERKKITLKVGRETAGRRGKGVTTVFDLPLTETETHELAALLKQRCGTGGTVKDGRIEIQGDQRDRIVAELEKLGYKVKRVGG